MIHRDADQVDNAVTPRRRNTVLVSERNINAKLAIRKLHLHARELLLHDAHTIVNIQRTRSRAFRVGRDDKLEVLNAQLVIAQPCGPGARSLLFYFLS